MSAGTMPATAGSAGNIESPAFWTCCVAGSRTCWGFKSRCAFNWKTSARLYPSTGVSASGREDGREAGEFCPILFRAAKFSLDSSGTFWFSDTPEIPSRTWGNRVTRICTWARLIERDSGTAFYFYNVHLDHESQAARVKGVSLLLSRIRKRPADDPVIVTGDFNAEPDNAAIIGRCRPPTRRFPSALLPPSRKGPTGTFHGFTGTATGGPD